MPTWDTSGAEIGSAFGGEKETGGAAASPEMTAERLKVPRRDVLQPDLRRQRSTLVADCSIEEFVDLGERV
jgi:hypothetical protein